MQQLVHDTMQRVDAAEQRGAEEAEMHMRWRRRRCTCDSPSVVRAHMYSSARTHISSCIVVPAEQGVAVEEEVELRQLFKPVDPPKRCIITYIQRDKRAHARHCQAREVAACFSGVSICTFVLVKQVLLY